MIGRHEKHNNLYTCYPAIVMTQLTKKVWLSARDYIFIVIGLLMYSFGFSAFVFPEKVVIGGVTGLSTIIYFLTSQHLHWGVPVAVSQFVINAVLLAIAWRKVGKTFVIRTIVGATVLSLGIGFFTPLFPEPLVQGQQFMNVLIGALLCGFGVGLVLIHNGSTGGTDIVAAMVAKKTNVSFGRMMIYIDVCIIGSSYFLFHNLDTTIFGMVFLLIVPLIADYIINTNRQAVEFTIISSKWEEIAEAVLHQASRGCTVIDGIGWYSRKPIKLLLVMCRQYESVTIFRIIKSIDEHAFITQTKVNGVYGEGFDTIKLKLRRKPADASSWESARTRH